MEKLIYERMSAVMREVGSIGKDNRNQQQGYAFRGIEDVYAAVYQAMTKHKVFNTCKVLETSSEQVVNSRGTKGYRILNRYEYTFHTTDGSSISTEAIGEAVDYGDKAANKAASISHKYAIIQAFCIPTKDIMPDPDAESHNLAAKPQPRVDKPQSKKPSMPQDRVDALGKLRKVRKDITELIARLDLKTDLDEVMERVAGNAKPEFWVTDAPVSSIYNASTMLSAWVMKIRGEYGV